MYITARERKILEVILLSEEETTVSSIAKILNVSSRTVHRDLKGVEEILKSYDLSLSKQSGVGILVKGSSESKEKLKLFLFSASHNEYTPDERQTIILSSLLESLEPVKLVVLASDLNVTIATVSNDLNKIEEKIEPFGLSLIRKRGYGVELSGLETAKRKVMSSLILDHLDEFEFISFIRENIQKRSAMDMDTATDRLLGLVDKKKLIIIESIIDDVKKELPYPIADSAYIGLVVHLALATERIQQGVEIVLDDRFPEQLVSTKEYKIAEKIVSGLETAFQISVSQGEASYITMHLLGAKLRNEQGDIFEETAVQVGYTAQKLIQYVGNRMGYHFENNIDLYQGLIAHLRPAIYRMKQHMKISNPLLERIMEDYHELFSMIQDGVEIVFPDFKVPKEEIGFLVMHFASAMLKGEENKQMNGLVVCSSGIGTSKILATKIQKELPWLKTKNVSLFDFEQINPEEYSIIISTVPLKDYQGQYVLVSPILSQAEIERIKQSVRVDLPDHPKNEINSSLKNDAGKDFFARIQRNNRFTSAAIDILSGYFIQKLRGDFSVATALLAACETLQQQGIINDAEKVVNHLAEREALGGLGIPETTLSLYHTRSTEVTKPSFTMYELEKPVKVSAMDGTEIFNKRILLMLSPQEASEESLEILSQISASIIRNEDSIHLYESGEKDALFGYLCNEIRDIFETKNIH
ncbi:BglG family transcription antiterminator [Robertmurraya korlensis]|uniref:BglG family transcription antiterminator n=1 Tax=Robertmurraya korlensis TaxID=519977 RepID=UPI0020409A46|nr:BglG family transcription antiterminator [Robertmurraya korlensis]MCM3603273.1 BglG family transcription antiterminator [Robertmurraya korlensis]